MKKILIGSCGGLTGYYLTKNFIKKPEYEVCGFDSGDAMATGKILNRFFSLPPASNEEIFVDSLIELINNQKVDYYFPTHSKETRVVAKYEDYIRRNTNVGFVISPYSSYLELDEKDKGNKSLAAIDIPVPQSYSLDSSDICFPVFVKHKRGSGSHDAQRVDSLDKLKACAVLYEDIAIFEYIQGTEYTVDAVFDNNGKLISMCQRVRKKQLGGATICTYTDYSIDVSSYIKRISDFYTLKGVVNFQFILRDGIPYFTDINLRYASGGLPLAVYSGINIFEMLPRIIDGDEIDDSLYKIKQSRVVMYRHFEEVYENIY